MATLHGPQPADPSPSRRGAEGGGQLVPAGTLPAATPSAVAWSARPAQLDQVLPVRDGVPLRPGWLRLQEAVPAIPRHQNARAVQGQRSMALIGLPTQLSQHQRPVTSTMRPRTEPRQIPTIAWLRLDRRERQPTTGNPQALAFRATHQILRQRRPQRGGLSPADWCISRRPASTTRSARPRTPARGVGRVPHLDL